MAKAQMNWIEANENFETAMAAAEAEKERIGLVLPDNATEEELDAFIEADIAIDNQFDYWPLFHEMTKARSELLQWAKQFILETQAHRSNVQEIAEVFDKVWEFPQFMDEAMDAALRLAA